MKHSTLTMKRKGRTDFIREYRDETGRVWLTAQREEECRTIWSTRVQGADGGV
jgi:hypothetical protein